MSKFINMIGNLGTVPTISGVAVGFSHFNHDFAMAFFNSKVRKYFWKYCVQSISGDIAFVNGFSVWVFNLLLGFRLSPVLVSKKGADIFNLIFVYASEFKNASVVRFLFWISMFNIVHIKATIPVYISRKIDPVFFFHSTVKSYFTLYGDCLEERFSQPKRLNEWAPKGDAKVWTRSKEREIEPKSLVRQFIYYIYINWSNKVTECRVYATYIVLTRQVSY